MRKLVVGAVALLISYGQWGHAQAPTTPEAGATPAAVTTPTTPHRILLDADTAGALISQKVPIKYPDSARNARTQGKVVLKIVVSKSGEVEEVTSVMGDALLTQAATESIKQWRYKPYLVDGSAVEFETEFSVNFQFTIPAPVVPPALGTFADNVYSNGDFGIYYPLSKDWVRETGAMRAKIASSGSSNGVTVLLAAVHIPQDTDPLRADSTFTVLATNRFANEDCEQFLQRVADELNAKKEGKQKGVTTKLSIAGHDFYRADFEYRHDIDHGAIVCGIVKDYMLRWNIAGWSREAVETAAATLNSITSSAPVAPPPPSPTPRNTSPPVEAMPQRVRVSSGVSTGLLIKKVTPIYPAEAKYKHIQGSVVMQARINKMGDVVDLEVVSGPIELVVSAVNAVRKWKYKPYLLMGEPVNVETQVVVNYFLQF